MSWSWSAATGHDLVLSVNATRNAAFCVSFNLRHLHISDTLTETIPFNAQSISVIQFGREKKSKSVNNCCNNEIRWLSEVEVMLNRRHRYICRSHSKPKSLINCREAKSGRGLLERTSKADKWYKPLTDDWVVFCRTSCLTGHWCERWYHWWPTRESPYMRSSLWKLVPKGRFIIRVHIHSDEEVYHLWPVSHWSTQLSSVKSQNKQSINSNVF